MGRKWMYDSDGEVVTLADVFVPEPRVASTEPLPEGWEIPADPWLDTTEPIPAPPF